MPPHGPPAPAPRPARPGRGRAGSAAAPPRPHEREHRRPCRRPVREARGRDRLRHPERGKAGRIDRVRREGPVDHDPPRGAERIEKLRGHQRAVERRKARPLLRPLGWRPRDPAPPAGPGQRPARIGEGGERHRPPPDQPGERRKPRRRRRRPLGQRRELHPAEEPRRGDRPPEHVGVRGGVPGGIERRNLRPVVEPDDPGPGGEEREPRRPRREIAQPVRVRIVQPRKDPPLARQARNPPHRLPGRHHRREEPVPAPRAGERGEKVRPHRPELRLRAERRHLRHRPPPQPVREVLRVRKDRRYPPERLRERRRLPVKLEPQRQRHRVERAGHLRRRRRLPPVALPQVRRRLRPVGHQRQHRHPVRPEKGERRTMGAGHDGIHRQHPVEGRQHPRRQRQRRLGVERRIGRPVPPRRRRLLLRNHPQPGVEEKELRVRRPDIENRDAARAHHTIPEREPSTGGRSRAFAAR